MRSSVEELEAVVEAVVARLVGAGLVGAPPPPPVTVRVEGGPESADAKPVLPLPEDTGPGRDQRQLWLEELRGQQHGSPRLGPREREEVRSLLIIGDVGGPPPEHHLWYWARVRLFIIVAHHGWTAAINDAQNTDLDRLGIRLSPVTVGPPATGSHPAHTSPTCRGVASTKYAFSWMPRHKPMSSKVSATSSRRYGTTAAHASPSPSKMARTV